jgi:hypothetical protein
MQTHRSKANWMEILAMQCQNEFDYLGIRRCCNIHQTAKERRLLGNDY